VFFSQYVQDPLVQEFLPGPEITTDVVCDLEGSVLGIVSRRRIEVRAGEVSKGVTIYDADIQEACVRIAEALPAVGPITVQCIMKDGKPVFTEINARLGGGIPLAVAAGLNAPALILARVAAVQIDVPPLGAYETGLHITRYDQSFFLKNWR
jgi:carbamoyl-phosphate synthase large subunit